MNESYSVFIPSVEKDFVKLPFVLDSIKKYLTGYKDIWFVIPWKSLGKFREHINLATEPGCSACDEESWLPDVDRLKFNHRPNWIFQQYLKLFQDVTDCDLYLTVDSDLIFNRPYRLFDENGKRIIWGGWDQNHSPYFRFQERMLNLPREFPHTGINDSNFMSKRIIREMLERNGYTVQSFIEKSYDVITPSCYPAENEIHVQYCMKYHSDKYVWKQAKTMQLGRPVSSTDDSSAYTTEEISRIVKDMEKEDIDSYSLHSWFGANSSEDLSVSKEKLRMLARGCLYWARRERAIL